MDILIIANHRAVISRLNDTDMLRGEFIGLNGGADFYAGDLAGLKEEGAKSLQLFLDTCEERGIDPYRQQTK
jgi:predicted HicB family RNase H-like nuclease